MAPLLNYTTVVPVPRTLSDVIDLLVRAGAVSVAADYAAGSPSGVSFRVDTTYGVREFQLPVPPAAPVLELLLADQAWKRSRKAKPTLEQAERVAWRILKDWIEAQMALIQIEAVSLDQVMLPYMTGDDGRSVYELYVERETDRLLALEAGS